MAKIKIDGESVFLNNEEMDMIFNALEKLEKEGQVVLGKAVKLRAGGTVEKQVEFNKKVEELKQKFLHA